ncbi:unannotated protein [freshwater metagenome]|uniref:Unannotated protein n=1 Tax=freshwater metagenome TaxID=449393 RepID=A0A6J7GA50_9ZZZZ
MRGTRHRAGGERQPAAAGDDRASRPAAVALALDLAQDAAVHDRGGGDRAAAGAQVDDAREALLVERVGARDLVAQDGLAAAGRQRAEALHRLGRHVDAALPGVLVDVAQDVRALHRAAERRGGRQRAVGVVHAEHVRHHDADGPGDAVAVAVQLLLRARPAAGEVVAHAGAEVLERRARQVVARGERLEDPGLAPADVAARAPVLDGGEPLVRVGPALVHHVVELAEDEVEQVDVVAHPGGQDAAGDREGPGDPARGRPRLGQGGPRVEDHLPVRRRGAHQTAARAAGRRGCGWSAVTRPLVTSAPIRTPGMPAPGCVPPPT